MSKHTKGKWTIEPMGIDGNPNERLIIGHPNPDDFQVIRTIGRLFAYGTKEENEANACLIAAAPNMVEELADYKEGCEGLKLTIIELRPYAEAYKRICESLGIKENILGYIEELKKQRDDLLSKRMDQLQAEINQVTEAKEKRAKNG